MGNYSEIAPLKKILIHSPDAGIAKVTPDLAADFLYEDIVFLSKIQEEHAALKSVLENYLGTENCLEITDLLTSVLKDKAIREQFVEVLCTLEKKSRRSELLDLTAEQLCRYSIEGDVAGQVYPVPNLIFTRDIGSVAGPLLIHATAAKKARARESLISWFVFHHHTAFKRWSSNGLLLSPANDLEELIRFLSMQDAKPQLEGGDIMMISKNHLLIGSSERTNDRGIALIKQKLQSHHHDIDYLSVAYMPASRYCMHWDTVFTFTDYNEAVAYQPLLNNRDNLPVKTIGLREDKEIRFKNFQDFISEFIPGLALIPCGDGLYPFDQREQWTDGCNFFALKPGVIIGYDRNEKTLEAFAKRGYHTVDAHSFLKSQQPVDSLEKTIITLKSSELSRARGGPHCLTFPLERT
ncbi:MAG TPA: arginine deiminase family protein [Cytophagaceae bacterium]|jgi:arginine deiminase|nr:arginine deiminase family protein [Cytophagaceae bacterium]